MASAENKQIEDDVELKMDLGDLDMGKLLGEGSFSEVYVGKPKQRVHKTHPIYKYGDQFACKLLILRTINVNRNKKKIVGCIMREKRALYHCRRLKIPFTMQLYATAKNSEKIAFITQLLPNGDLLDSLTKYGAFNYNACQYYMSCIVSTMDNLHNIGIIHRDLKPENIMLNENYQPIICDFGCVKIIPSIYNRYISEESKNADKTKHTTKFTSKIYDKEDKSIDPDFIGTPEFMAPELLKTGDDDDDDDDDDLSDDELDTTPVEAKENNNNNGDKDKDTDKDKDKDKEDEDDRMKEEYYKCLDFWSLGCLLYQLNTGKLLFHGQSEWLVFQKVIKMEINYPKNMNKTIKDLISKLLIKEPMNRIGVKDINHLKRHEFFDGVEWEKLESMDAPYLNEKNKADREKK